MDVANCGSRIADCGFDGAVRAWSARPANPKSEIRNPKFLFRNPKLLSRRGITLLEVLISMFVLLIGLLGVASLIPVGKFEVQRGAKIDRASACGRAAFREIKVRGMLNPASWALADNPAGTAVNNPAGLPSFAWNANAPTTADSTIRAFVIDPLGVHTGDTSDVRCLGSAFPVPTAGTTTSVNLPSAPTAADIPLIPRLTLGPGNGLNAIRAAMADAVFRWQDDLVFETPNNADNLPMQRLQGDARRLSVGDYSWIATVAPDPAITDATNWLDVPWRVSIAVFYKRELGSLHGGERICRLDSAVVNMQDEVRLRVNAAADVAPQYGGDGKKHLDVKPGQWIMLAGWVDPDGAGALQARWHFRWHRIVSADETQGTGPWTRNLTLVGPFTEPNGVNVPVTNVSAYLFDGVIAVYEKNMKLELDSMFQ